MAGTDGPARPGPVHGREGVQPRQRRGRGVLRPYEGPGPCISGHWEERTCEEAGGLAGEYIRWYNHSRIKQSLGWKSPVEYRTSQGLAV
nr:IS3 family transposase [uncultured Bifidobacterium sp.]